MKPSLICFVLIACASVNARPGGRIVGGQDAATGQFPYQISYQVSWNEIWYHYCGGSVISPTWILSAGHCITEDQSIRPTQVVLGITNMNDTNEEKQVITVKERIPHPEYAGGIGPNDIALFKLEVEIVFSDLVQPIKLPNRGFEASGNAIASGWGGIDVNGMLLPNTLQYVELPFISLKECRDALDKLYGKDEDKLDDTSNICTGPLTGGKSPCFGDSGGPLVQNGTVIGVVSWGYTICAYEGAPAVFTKVSNFLDFIESNVDDLPKQRK